MRENQVLSMQKQFIARLAIQSCFIFFKRKDNIGGSFELELFMDLSEQRGKPRKPRL